MLEQLLIKDFAIIEDLEVSFGHGFNALCGETGAGKSIIIDALNLLLGERSSFDKIRFGKQKAFIEGVFVLDNESLKQKISAIIDEEIEDDTLIITRTLDINGKSYSKVNSHAINLSSLKKIAELILDVHSAQHNFSYLDEENQSNLLDLYINQVAKQEEKEILSQYLEEYKLIINQQKEIQKLNELQDDLGTLDYLNYQKAELQKANIQENEMENLEEEKASLANFSRLSERIVSFLNEYQSAQEHLFQAKKQLSYLNEEPYNELNEKFVDLYYQMEDVYQSIDTAFNDSKASLMRLDEINDRLYYLHTLRKKYGYTTKDILDKYQEICDSIDSLANYENRLAELNKTLSKLEKNAFDLAEKIHFIKEKYSHELENLINTQLKDLYLENAEFKIELTKLSSLKENGFTEVKFLLKANKGSDFVSLEKTASLGETSRLNLALKTVFNKLYQQPTIIFDEIDIGLSGRVSTAVSNKMKEISQNSQVIAISHLVQVAANCDNLYLVKKEVISDKTYSNIYLLNEEERKEEIAKMMMGQITESSLKASEDLINSFK